MSAPKERTQATVMLHPDRGNFFVALEGIEAFKVAYHLGLFFSLEDLDEPSAREKASVINSQLRNENSGLREGTETQKIFI